MKTTYQQGINNTQTILEQLQQLFDKALTKVTEKQLSAHTVTVKIKYHDFVQITRSRTLPHRITASTKIQGLLERLLQNTDVGRRDVRLLRITLSSLDGQTTLPSSVQIDLSALHEQIDLNGCVK